MIKLTGAFVAFAGRDIFDLDKIFFPVNYTKYHWACVVIFMGDKRIQYYDSLREATEETGDKYVEFIRRYLHDEYKHKKGCPMPDQDQWTLVGSSQDTPKQLNGFDCGVFMCMICDFLSVNRPLTFNQQHIDRCRDRMALSIIEKKAP